MMKTGNPCSQDGALNIKNAWDPGGALTQSTHKMSGNVCFLEFIRRLPMNGLKKSCTGIHCQFLSKCRHRSMHSPWMDLVQIDFASQCLTMRCTSHMMFHTPQFDPQSVPRTVNDNFDQGTNIQTRIETRRQFVCFEFLVGDTQVSTTCHVLFSHIHVTNNNSMFEPWLKTESVAAASRGELLTGRFVRTW